MKNDLLLERKRLRYFIKDKFKRCYKCGSDNFVLNGYIKSKHPTYKCRGCGYAGYCFPLRDKNKEKAKSVISDYWNDILLRGKVLKSVSYFCEFKGISRGTFYKWKRLYLEEVKKDIEDHIKDLSKGSSADYYKNIYPNDIFDKRFKKEKEKSSNKKKKRKKKNFNIKKSNKKKKKKKKR